MPTYSTRLAAASITVAAGRVLAFTVPAGHRVVVRQVSGQAASGAGVALLLYIGGGGPLVHRASFPAGSDNTTSQDVRVVYHEGEACYVRALVAAVDYALHGYLLAGAGGPLTPGTLPSP